MLHLIISKHIAEASSLRRVFPRLNYAVFWVRKVCEARSLWATAVNRLGKHKGGGRRAERVVWRRWVGHSSIRQKAGNSAFFECSSKRVLAECHEKAFSSLVRLYVTRWIKLLSKHLQSGLLVPNFACLRFIIIIERKAKVNG